MFTSLKLKLYLLMPMILAITACGDHKKESSSPEAIHSEEPKQHGYTSDYLKCQPLALDDPGIDITIYDEISDGSEGETIASYVVTSGGKFEGATGNVVESRRGDFIFETGPLGLVGATIFYSSNQDSGPDGSYHITIGASTSECRKE